jgi:hypothetical protein
MLTNVLLISSIISAGYPICTVIESEPQVFTDIVCYDTNVYRGRRFCSEKEGVTPGGIFTEFLNPFRYVLLTDQCPEEFVGPLGWCLPPYEISGYAHRKEVVRNENGVAVVTGLIKLSAELIDSFEELDQFGQSSCIFSFTPASPQTTNEQIMIDSTINP